MNTLYTLGYAKIKPGQLLQKAEELNAIVADIRFSPASRKPEWSGKRLRELLGFSYVHLKALGNENYKGGPIKLVDADAGTEAVRVLLEKQPVILLCVCADVNTCHRKTAAEHIAAQLGVTVEHISALAMPVALYRQPKLF